MPWLELRDTLAAFLTPAIGVGTLFIAYQQWRIERLKLKLDRYEKRLNIYEEVRRFLGVIQQNAKAELEDLFRFKAMTSEADFLFGAEIPEYLDEIYKQGIQLTVAVNEYRDSTQPVPQGYDHEAVVNRKHDALTWLTSQFDPAKSKFKKYLQVKE
ncbi:MAG: hypothetical protein ACX939_09800 [Hyphococcus sp.]